MSHERKRISPLNPVPSMNTSDQCLPWKTSSCGCACDPSPEELSTLQAHVERCKRVQSRWFSVQCATEGLNGLVAGHFVTTLVVLSAAMLLLIVIASYAPS